MRNTKLSRAHYFSYMMSTHTHQNRIVLADPKMIATKGANASSRIITSDEEVDEKEQIRRWEREALANFRNSAWEGKSVSHDMHHQ